MFVALIVSVVGSAASNNLHRNPALAAAINCVNMIRGAPGLWTADLAPVFPGSPGTAPAPSGELPNIHMSTAAAAAADVGTGVNPRLPPATEPTGHRAGQARFLHTAILRACCLLGGVGYEDDLFVYPMMTGCRNIILFTFDYFQCL